MEYQKKEETIMKHCNSLSSRGKRNLDERSRRIRFKDLCVKLRSLIPTQNSKLSVSDLVDQATAYTKQLQEKIKRLEERKQLPLLKGDTNFEPLIYVKSSESTLEVTIVTGLKKNFLWHQVIQVLEDEGAQVVSTTYHNARDRIFYTICSQPKIPRIGIEDSRVEERLKKLIS